jgi:hypothetical protein
MKICLLFFILPSLSEKTTYGIMVVFERGQKRVTAVNTNNLLIYSVMYFTMHLAKWLLLSEA